MSDTPETDAARHDLSDYGSPVLCSWGDWVDADFARKLERERDEVKTELEMWRDGNIMHQIHRDELEKAECERDELRRMSVTEMMGHNLNVKHHVTEWENRCIKAERERDEVTKDLEFRRELYKVQEQYLETARAELSLKCQSVTIASGTISDLIKKSERLEKQIEGLNNFANERFDEIQRVRRERDEAREIAGRLAHFLERPAYSVDEAIARMEALNSYKKQKSQ